MKMWSDTLTTNDLYHAAEVAHVYLHTADPIRRPRNRARGWTVYLEGASPYASQATGGRAATWDQWGEWMDALFAIDPEARIGQYDGRDDFYRQTGEAIAHNERYAEIVGKPRPGVTGPWLRCRNCRTELSAEDTNSTHPTLCDSCEKDERYDLCDSTEPGRRYDEVSA